MTEQWPLPTRKKYLDELEPTKATHRLTFKGKIEDFPIKRIPLDLPRYRLANGRTAAAQLEYLSNHPEVDRGLFSDDPERQDAQRAQHAILKEMISQSGLREKFERPSVEQVDPILLDGHGHVINGNRRLCTWRTLRDNDPQKYKKYEYIDVVVLPEADERAIDELEASLQVDKDVRADYTWEALAAMMQRRKNEYGYSDENLAELYSLSLSEVRRSLDMLQLAGTYLTWKKLDNHWSAVSKNEFAFRKVAEGKKQFAKVDERSLFQQASFVLIGSEAQQGERLYDLIPAAQRYFPQVRDGLSEKFGADIDDEPAADDIFGDTAVSLDLKIASVLNDEKRAEEAALVIRDVLEACTAAEKEKETSKYLQKQVAKAAAALQNASTNGLRDGQDVAGVLSQLEVIEGLSFGIRKWLNAAD